MAKGRVVDEDAGVVDGSAVEEEVAEASKPPAADLVVRPGVPDDVFRAMDAADEAQVLDALMGKPSEKLVYSFGSGGNRKTGLSYEGIAEVVRELNANGHTKIRIAKDVAPILRDVQEDDENGRTISYVEALVYAEDTLNGGGDWGAARQARFQVFSDENRKPRPDPFATAKALSKAQRNAFKPLTPVVFREALIAKMLNNPARVLELRVGMGDPTAEMPPPLTDDRAKKLVGEIRGVYKRIRDVDPMVLPPGRFNIKLTRAEHEHERLEELLGELVSMLEHMAAKAAA